MNNEFVNNFMQFMLTIVGLSIVALVIAYLFYLVIKPNLGRFRAFDVNHGDPAHPGVPTGIPFYVKKSRFIHETSYLETLAMLTLTAKRVHLDDKMDPKDVETIFAGAKTVSINDVVIDKIQELRQAAANMQLIRDANHVESNWNAIVQLFDRLPSYNGEIPTCTIPLASNEVKENVYIDYQDPFYINKRQPLSGTTETNITLASDGTLSTYVGKTDDQLVSTLFGVLPFDNLKTQSSTTSQEKQNGQSTYASGTPFNINTQSGQGNVENSRLEISLTIENVYVRHIFSEDRGVDRSFAGQLDKDPKRYAYRREVLSSLQSETKKPADPPEKKDDQGKEDKQAEKERVNGN